MSTAALRKSALLKQVLNQGALMLAGFGGAQVLGFLRNILLAHLITKGDFGTAAALTIALQTFEMVSDVAVDRLILQASDDNDLALMANGHTVLLLRAALMSLLLWLAAPLFAQAFSLVEATTAFRAVALIPLLKGFMHLDCRRAQRRLDNRAAVLVEIIPQALALAAVWPAVAFTHDYTAALWVTGIQAAATSVVSHLMAKTRYRLALDGAELHRFLHFGWPILLSAIPLLAVFQGDRAIVARYQGVEALAGYTVAFLVTMVPATLAVRVGLSLMLPLLAENDASPVRRNERFTLMFEVAVLAASLYLAGFLMLGGDVVRLAFGHNYDGYGSVTGALALMWALRLLQAPFGAFLMSAGDNRPLLIAGVIRALALVPTLLAAWLGMDLAMLGLCGALGELACIVYFAWWMRRDFAPLSRVVLSRTSFLGLTICITTPFWHGSWAGLSLPVAGAMAAVVALFVVAAAAAIMPSTRAELRSLRTAAAG
jgi:O-antigen/teichoic acid export membrane protein